jgi:TrmH family RNA methyltransferase
MSNCVDSKNWKKYLQLTGKRSRYKNKLFLVESYRCIEHFLKKNTFEKDECLLKVKGNLQAEKFLEKFPNLPPVFDIEEKDFSQITTQSISQGLLGIAKLNLQKNFPSPITPSTSLFIAGLSDPENMGVILRIAAVRNIKNIFVYSKHTVDPFHPRAVRCSLGGIFYTNIYLIDDIDSFLLFMKKIPFTIIEPNPAANTPLKKFPFLVQENYLLLVGNEIKGILPSIKPYIDYSLSIPQNNCLDSINTATAAAIFIYEFTQRFF